MADVSNSGLSIISPYFPKGHFWLIRKGMLLREQNVIIAPKLAVRTR